jgi:hypothetical protein
MIFVVLPLLLLRQLELLLELLVFLFLRAKEFP